MYNSEYLLNFFLFAVSCAHFVNCRPLQRALELEVADGDRANYVIHLPLDMVQRKRQVVQPTWLTDTTLPLLPGDGKVTITKENMAETAALRDEIQKAVEEGRYYVDIDQDNMSNEMNTVPPTAQRSAAQQTRQFGPSSSTFWNPTQWSMVFQEQQPQLFNPSTWNPSQWSMSFQQPQRGGASQSSIFNPAQWAMPFQQQQQQQLQFFGPSPLNQNQQWSMQFGWPAMRSQQPNPMRRMWNDLMQNTRRMFDP
ncbi:uncharacterized protein [Eurosta solidaginis]|uniref:uncharacterized protein n=1 Tax=Eurosta solidaginis TaxID=178769 RepID=UPI0035314CC2